MRGALLASALAVLLLATSSPALAARPAGLAAPREKARLHRHTCGDRYEIR